MKKIECTIRSTEENTVILDINLDENIIGDLIYTRYSRNEGGPKQMCWSGHVQIEETYRKQGCATQALIEGDGIIARLYPNDLRFFTSSYSFSRYKKTIAPNIVTTVGNNHPVFKPQQT
jgi:hypothetical protein